MNLFQKLLHDEHGFIITTELVIIATLLVVGLITGIQCLQAAVVSELKDVGESIGSLNQSYCFSGMRGCWSWGCGRSSWTRGSCYADQVDEYRSDVEIGCLDLGERYQAAPVTSHPGAVIQQQSIELAPIEVAPGPVFESQPAPAGDCPPGSTVAPDNCPPALNCPAPADDAGSFSIW